MFLAVLLVVRVTAAIVVAPPVVADASGYDASAYRLLETGSFAYPLYHDAYWSPAGPDMTVDAAGKQELLTARPNAYTMPGYPAFLAAIWRVTGYDDDRLMVARVAQALLSVVTAALVFVLARRVSERVGLISLGLLALYPPFTLANSYLTTEPLHAFLTAALCVAYLEWLERPTPARAALVGLIVGLGLWVRPVLALWVVAATVVVLWRHRSALRRWAAQAAVMALAAVLVMAPWWIRSYVLYDRVVPFGTSTSVTVIEGLRRDVTDKTPFPWRRNGPAMTSEDREIAALIQKARDGAPDTSEDDLALLRYHSGAVSSISRQVIDSYPSHVVSARGRSVLVSLTWPAAVAPGALGGMPFAVSWVAHALLLALSAVGVWLGRARKEVLIPASLLAYAVAFHAPILPLWRYYLPFLPLACIAAAVALSALLRLPRAR